jgi:hypothetical protein
MTASSPLTLDHGRAFPAHPAAGALMVDFLTWVAAGPRTHADVMDVWRSSCPRFTIWEDALGDGLVRLERAGATDPTVVVALTARGREVLGR